MTTLIPKYDLGSSSAVNRPFNQKLQEFVSVKDYGATGNGTTDDTTAILNAISDATTNGYTLYVPTGTYILSGSTTLPIDIGHMSLVSDGTAILNCSAMTATYAVQIFSSLSYPSSHTINTSNKLSGINFVSNHTSGKYGLLVGHATYANNGQTFIEHCSFEAFDINLSFTNNAWRTCFYGCSFGDAVTHQIYAPSGLSNMGESFGFYHCMIFDGGDINISSQGSQWFFYSSSVLNVPIVNNGDVVKIEFYGGNIENPGATTPYTYATLTSNATNGSKIAFYGTGITLNTTTFPISGPLFSINNAAASMTFENITWPQTVSPVDFTAGGTLPNEYVGGSAGNVKVNGSNYWATGGGSNPAISLFINEVRNGDFESGNMIGWTVTPYGTTGSTMVASSTAKKNGSYGCLATSVSGGGCNSTQTKPCKPGQLTQVSAWVYVATGAVSPEDYVQVQFNDASGNVIATYGDSVTSLTTWSCIGSGCAKYAPAGTATVTFVLNVQPGGNVVYFDDIVFNIS